MSYFEVPVRFFHLRIAVLFFVMSFCCPLFSQTISATLSASVSDPSGAVIQKAEVTLGNSETNQQQQLLTDASGNATFPFLRPGHYTLLVSKEDFAEITVDHIVLNVGDEKHLRLSLHVGGAAQTIAVDGSGLTVNTADGSVSTVINSAFVENIPLNGRSFQDLISMTPGVTTQSPQAGSQLNTNGDFSVNGQRTESNYYIVDGVSGNIGSGNGYGGPSAGAGGSLPGSTALGTTQGLLSVDALQEFRVESSSYSAEYGHTPGGQFSFVTRSGTNNIHGSAFDYLRNNYFDASDWFNDHYHVAQPALRQNDFGGTLGGPAAIPKLYNGKDKTFFFVSYEGLKLAQPQAATIQYVPDTYLRQQAAPALQSILNAFPIQNGIDYGNASSPSLAQFIQAYSVPSSINSTSVRIDQKIASNTTVFFRYSDTPTNTESRAQSVLTTSQVNSRAYTAGETSQFGSALNNEFRLGYASSRNSIGGGVSDFGGATPINLSQTLGLGNSPTTEAEFLLYFPSIGGTPLITQGGSNVGSQWNIVDTVSRTWKRHQFKFGVDYRRITTTLVSPDPYAIGEFTTAASVMTNKATLLELLHFRDGAPLFHQTSLFAQDEWRISNKLAISLGTRWEVDPPPGSTDGTFPYTLLGSVADPSTLTLAPAGTPLWRTTWYNFAPRLGVAWTANGSQGWETVVRGGGGVFFDSANQMSTQGYNGIGFTATKVLPSGSSFPVTPAQLDFQPSVSAPYGTIYAYPSHLQLPYTLQWNASVEQAMGKTQTVTLSYVGANGRRLMGEQEYSLAKLNPNFGTVFLFPTNLTSSYNALQANFQRSVRKGVQALASYTWAHSLDFGSTYAALPLMRADSDFDVRNTFSGGLSWELSSVRANRLVKTVLDDWGLDGRLIARTGFPISLNGSLVTDTATGTVYHGGVNLISDRPLYLYGSQYPGGRAINGGPTTTTTTAAFVTAGTGIGNAPRNLARGFGENQINLAARRDIKLNESMRLQFRAEAFNILNRPNFGYVDPTLTDATFGQTTKMLNSSLATVASAYQQGGSRSMQFLLKVAF